MKYIKGKGFFCKMAKRGGLLNKKKKGRGLGTNVPFPFLPLLETEEGWAAHGGARA